MGSDDMGRVLTEVTIYNQGDLYEVRRGTRAADQVRKVVVTNALVDSGASTLALPKSLIDQLGLVKFAEKRVRTASGHHVTNVYDAVRVEIMGRNAVTDPIEVPEGNPVLVGQIPLEAMDWVIDMKNHKLIGNPEHGGEEMLELFTFLP